MVMKRVPGDLDRLRLSPAYRRVVWGLRLLMFGPILLAIALLFAFVGLHGGALAGFLAVAFAAVGLGVGLVWSAAFPLLRQQRVVLAPLSRLRRSSIVRKMLIRDVARLRWRPVDGRK